YTGYGRYDDALDAWLLNNGYSRDGKPDGNCIWLAPNELLWAYSAIDSVVPWDLWPLLADQIRAAGLWEAFTGERMPLALEYAERDRHGVPMSREALGALDTTIGEAKTAVREGIGRHVQVTRCKQHRVQFAPCGCARAKTEPLNPNSP